MVDYDLYIKANNLFQPAIYHIIYMYDGLILSKGKKCFQDIWGWLEGFQVSKKMGDAVCNCRIQFDMEIWTNEKNLPPSENKDKIQTSAADEYHLLYMEMICSLEGGTQFGIFRERDKHWSMP